MRIYFEEILRKIEVTEHVDASSFNEEYYVYGLVGDQGGISLCFIERQYLQHKWPIFSAENEDTFDKKGRITTRVGAWLAKRYADGVEIPQSFIDDFAAALRLYNKTREGVEVTYTEYVGKDIIEQYRLTGLQSCMTGEDADKTALLAYLPVKLRFYTTNNGKDQARVLIWTDHYGQEISDRIYASSDWLRSYVKKLHQEQGMLVRVRDSFDDKGLFFVGGKEEYIPLTVQVENTDEILEAACPYLDTFTYVYTESDSIYFCNTTKKGKADFVADNTDGRAIRGLVCSECGTVHRVEQVEIQGDWVQICADCLRERYVAPIDVEDYRPLDECVFCETDHEYYYYFEDTLIELRGSYYRKDDDNIVYSEYHEEYLFFNNTIYIACSDDYIKKSDLDEVIEINGEYYLKSNCVALIKGNEVVEVSFHDDYYSNPKYIDISSFCVLAHHGYYYTFYLRPEFNYSLVETQELVNVEEVLQYV